MATTSYYYEIKRGDTLSEIAVWYKNRIAGSTNKAKVKTLCKVNNIKNADEIYVGQKIKFSASASTNDTLPPENRTVENLVLALQAGDTTGRELYAVWTWSRINTKGFKLRWSQHLNGVWQASDSSFDIPEGTPRNKYVEYNNAEFTADKEAKKVRLQVLPVATNDSKDKPYWEENGDGKKDVAWATVEYDFANNPPLVPSAPTVEMHASNTKKIVIKYDSIKADELDAKYVQFNVVKNHTTSVLGASPNVTIRADNSVEYEYDVEYGATYRARARCVGANGKTSTWSEFSSDISTQPCAPKSIKSISGDMRDDGQGNKTYAVQLEWEKVANAQEYVIEYTTDLRNFDQNQDFDSKDTNSPNTSFCVTGIADAGLYYFRVRAATADGVSDPTPHVSIALGQPPAAPTIWSTSDSVFEGETMELNWTHNPRDGSKQSLAQIAIKIGDRDWVDTGNTFENTTTEDDIDPDSTSFQNPYPSEIPGAASSIGEVISYKGSLYFKMDTTHPLLIDKKIQWKVRTAAITSEFSADPTDWSPPKTIYIYSKPEMVLSVMSNLETEAPLENIPFATVEAASKELVYTDESVLPFKVHAEIDLPAYEPVGDIRYHVLVVSEDYFEAADETGTVRSIDIGDDVYSGVFDTGTVLDVTIPADQITLKKGLRYSIQCSAEMQLTPKSGVDDVTATSSITLSATNSSGGKLFENIVTEFDVNTITNALTHFPLYIRANALLDSYEIQRPIGYQVRITAGEYYETVDDTGRAKTVNAGDEVYSKYFNTGNEFLIELQANHVDFEPGIPYTIHCSADMSTGLTITETYDFNVYWKDVEYTIGADVTIDRAAYTADIMPYCMDTNGTYLDNIRLSVYRREYNGAFTEIATDVPNGGTAVTDPHPSLDYARYRISATDTNTGAVTFYDLPGHRVGCPGIVIQWDEDWSAFDASDANSAEPPEWSGSMLVFPYNVSVSDDRAREVATVAYAGREYPVVYYGTRLSESTQWSAVIPRDDTDTIYALRRLSIWNGPSYIREPSGMGFWAHVSPKFSISHDGLTIQINFDITRVEGGA